MIINEILDIKTLGGKPAFYVSTINIQFQKTGTGYINADNCSSFDVTGEKSYFTQAETVYVIIKFNFIDVETNTVLYFDKWDGSTWINKWASRNHYVAAPPSGYYYSCLAFCAYIYDLSNEELGDWRMRTVINGYEAWIGFNISVSGTPTDKYYGCVNNQCVEKADGPYKNDPTCQGTCVATDKYYGCVNNQCVEKADGPYKNDPTCQGTCAAPADDMLPLILGALGVGVGLGIVIIYFKK